MPDALPFRINDADNHFLEPEDMYERYIDPKHRDKVVRFVRDASGRRVQMYGSRPSKLAFTRESAPQTQEEIERLAASAAPRSGDESQAKPGDGGARAPGMFLNRLNPYRGKSAEERAARRDQQERPYKRGEHEADVKHWLPSLFTDRNSIERPRGD